MTATRDRDSDLDSDTPEVEWDDRPVLGSFRGLPWWGAVLLALVLSAGGAVVDRARLVDDERLNSLGIYQVAFLGGCVLAVLAVRRRNLFGPMVQPPLIFAVTFVPIQLMARSSTGTDTGAKKLIFEVGLPLASSFPWMAGATIATIVLGVIRLLIQRDPNARARRLETEEDDRPPRREARRPREEEPPAQSPRERRPRAEQRPDREDRPARDDRRPREDRAAPPQQARRREPGAQQRRPAREERPDRGERRERGDRPNRSEAPPARRNPQRPREREQGGKPRSPQQRRRPREDDYLD